MDKLERYHELVKKICDDDTNGGYPTSILNEIFDYASATTILCLYSPDEIIKRIDEYEEKESFSVGDEVLLLGSHKAVITAIDDDEAYFMFTDGSSTHKSLDNISPKNCKKTGCKYRYIEFTDVDEDYNVWFHIHSSKKHVL